MLIGNLDLMLKPSGGTEPVDVLPRQRSRSVVVAARPAYEPPITSTLIGECSPPPITNGFRELRKGVVKRDLEKERGDEALRAAWNCEGSRRRIGINISERKSGTCWSFIHRLRGGTGTKLSTWQALFDRTA
jgi:hypothetical protein